ncbi:MAG: sigma 54-interacting transcriptional regulator [Acidobacteriota bacterium]|nr:sigma 54-interacting transcriptional regulator [Acidobacteriota bacterium]
MRPARIMIVEDERITAEDIHDILTHLGYTVTAMVSTGAGAIFEAERSRPDLVMMDIRIQGDMDGIQAAREIRDRFDIPVVYLTAHADRETLDRAKLAEPLGYLIKPFQESELLASIEMALHKQKADRLSKQKDEILSATIQSIGEAMIATDMDGGITLMSLPAESWTGWTGADGRGARIDQVLQLKGRGRIGDSVSQAIRTGALVELPGGIVLVTRQGAERPVQGTVSPIRDHNGEVNGAAIVFGAAREDRARLAAVPNEKGPNVGFEIIAESEEMQRLMHFARRVAASEVSTILLRGESGAGKDVIANFLHHGSARASQPFLAINCAAIPDTLLESELFGYEKGAFTDARAQKKGILELASGGTVFLDEIGEMAPSLQAKLLRVLEEQKVRRLGGAADVDVDLRVITATNQDLAQAIQQGRFRLDLYYRINVIQIVVPPLRDHKQDLLPLANHFIASYNRKFKRAIQGLSPEAAEALLAHDWPGNIRELRNAIERAMVLEPTPWVSTLSLGLGSGDVTLAHPASQAPDLTGMSLEAAEKTMLLNALQKAGWNQTRASQLLSITRDTLRYKMKKFNLRPGSAAGPS